MRSMKLGMGAAGMAMRKQLARRMVDFETVYVLERNEQEGYLLLLALGKEQWHILESVAMDLAEERAEELREIPVGKEGIEAIRMALKHWSADKTPGRPAKYDLDKEGQEIFARHVYEGKTIRAIAKEFHMGPATVQKLLNRMRFKTADRFLNGDIPLSPDAPNYGKNIEVLRWAAKNSEGELRTRYADFLKSALSNL